MCECYSYFGEKPECLEDHINGMLKVLHEKFLSTDYVDILAKELEHIGIKNNSRELAKNMLLLSVILHDTGKGIAYFQRKKKGFKGHEFYSASAVEALKMLSGELFPKDAMEIIALAVAYHHHTMKHRRPLKEKGILSKECKATIEKIAKENGFDIQLPAKITAKRKSIDKKHYRAFLLVLFPLVVCDNLAAKSRGGQMINLGKALEQAFDERRKLQDFLREIMY